VGEGRREEEEEEVALVKGEEKYIESFGGCKR
jgi:hypothetical protein